MKKQVDKSMITIIILSIIFAISLSVTITFAAFSANKTGEVMLTFADGLTMTVTQRNYNADYLKITSAGVNDYTFNYATQSNLTTNPYYDGVVATLNKEAWVAYKVILNETTTNTDVAPAGTWRMEASNCVFRPSGERPIWIVVINIDTSLYDIVCSNNIAIFTSKTKWSADNLSAILWNHWYFRNRESGAATHYIDDLGGRAFRVDFTVKAQTDQAPTF